MATSLPQVEAFLTALNQQSLFGDANTPGSVLWYIAYYHHRAPNRKRAFRISGFLLLFLSISLPFITQLCPPRSCDRNASQRGGLPTMLGESATLLREIVSPTDSERDPTATDKPDDRSRWLMNLAARRHRNIATVAQANKTVRIA